MDHVVGILFSVGTAYLAAQFNNIMDFAAAGLRVRERAAVRHLPAGHVLEARHRPRRLLRSGLGTLAAALHHGLTLPVGAPVGIKGGWLVAAPIHTYPSEMAQNFWTAIWAWSICFAATIVISLLSARKKSDAELKGLVYSLTERPKEEHLSWWKTPAGFGALVLVLAIALNVIFW